MLWGAVAASFVFAAVPGQAETVRSGLARAQLARVVPYVGIPSVAAGAGVAQAEVSGGSAHASAGLADFGAMSLILGTVASKAPVPVPELPSPVTADDRDHPDVSRNPVLPSSPVAASEEAHASKAPASSARVRGPELGVPGVVTVTGGESRASADGGATTSTVSLGRLVLGGAGGVPEVVLSDLVWTARQAMGQPGTASFAIGAVTVAGQPLPVPAGSAPADALKAVNDAVAPLGLRLELPVSAGDAAGATVSALVVQVRNPETAAALLASATKPAVPVLNRMLDTLVAADPDAASSRLVVNALLAAGTTQGGGRLELGGASARIGNVEAADPPAAVPPPLPPVEAPPAVAAPAASATAPAAVPAPVPIPVAAPDSASGYGGAPAPSPAFEPAPPAVAPIAPPGAARTADAHAAPGGSALAARPAATSAPGGASAPIVLGAALLAVAVLAVGDKLRLRRSSGA